MTQLISQTTIICPGCHSEIELSEAFTHQITSRIQQEYNRKLADELSLKEVSIRQEVQEQSRLRVYDLEIQLQEKSNAFDLLQVEAQAVLARERAVQEKEHHLDLEVQRRLKLAEPEILERAERAVEAKQSLAIADLKDHIESQRRQLAAFENQQFKLLKEKRELEQRANSLELEYQQKLTDDLQGIYQEAQTRAEERFRLQVAEKDHKIAGLTKQIVELKQTAEQGSQQAQGEILELELESALRAAFPLHGIQPVPKGVKGADVIQKVYSRSGHFCGTIIWESKRSKNWNQDWLTKLQSDKDEAKADIAILVSTVLPKGVTHFGFVNGVWITDFSCAVEVATALSISLQNIARAVQAMEGRKEKAEVMYRYLCGQEFQAFMESTVRSLIALKQELDYEKRVMKKNWKAREIQLEAMLSHTAQFYGALQGIIGGALPTIPSLELPPDAEMALPLETLSSEVNSDSIT